MDLATARMIHLVGVAVNRFDTDPKHCIAAVVTHIADTTMYCTAFPWHGPEPSRRVVLKTTDESKWHDPRECPNATAT